ncbi:hypothetical protein B0T10DRAFT_500901 [Thelonectria olida]|uniref:BZIP domain-containing protein n=1 Tax=Thelonectria olida TaxID=1576542 RepID=A0A9P8VP00_9HYPO|nr:hypothetical protein B0T10DRAFT_500901 [Thelonectria olida]
MFTRFSMSAFVQGYPPPKADFHFSTGFNTTISTPSSPCLTTPPFTSLPPNSSVSPRCPANRGWAKKREMRPEAQGHRKGPSKVVKPEDSNVEVHPRETRRRRILERNRIAATKCRMQKRDEASALAAREQEMEELNRQLSRTLDELTAEIYDLKTQLLRHTDCNCILIQKYIAHEARKSVHGLTPCPSTSQPNMMPFVGYRSGPNGSKASVSVASATDSYGIRTPETESAPHTQPDPPPQGSSSREAMFDMTIEPIQREHIPVSSQPMPGMPSMHEHDYLGTWVGMGPRFSQ